MATRELKGQIEFFEKFGQMLSAGVPLGVTLRLLKEDLGSRGVKKEVTKICVQLETMDAKFKKFPEAFDPKFFGPCVRAMVRAGVLGGTLDYACLKIANCLRAELPGR